MVNDGPPEMIPVSDPIEHVKAKVTAKANEWLKANPSVSVILVFHQPITAIDPVTAGVFIEIQLDIVERSEGAILKAPVLERLYSTLGVVTRRVATPAEVAAEAAARIIK